MRTTLILLAGRKGVGKSTSANYLKDNLFVKNNRAVIKSFAGKLKEIAAIIGIPIELSTGTLEQKNSKTDYSWDSCSTYLLDKYENTGPMTVREVLQVLGTDVLRDCFNQDIWVKSLMNEIAKEICGPGGYVVNPGWQFLDNLYYLIDDCRLPNEVRNFNEYGFDRTIKILINRPTDQKDQHKSETALEGLPEFSFDYILNNTSTLDDLYKKLSKILGEIS